MKTKNDLKNEFLTILRTVNRDGIFELENFLNTSDFFDAPCSRIYHLNRPQGLVEHSLNVYYLLCHKCSYFKNYLNIKQITNDEIIISGLLHDVCKTNYYKENTKPNSDKVSYEVDEKLPIGHGEKSVIVLQEYIKLTKREKMAIRWHMGLFGVCQFDMKTYNQAQNEEPLVTLLHTADMEASFIVEG